MVPDCSFLQQSGRAAFRQLSRIRVISEGKIDMELPGQVVDKSASAI